MLPTGLETIGSYAFAGCEEMFFLRMPIELLSLGDGAFYGCSALRLISLPESLSELPAQCFFGCQALEHFSLPANISRIGEEAFAECESLVKIKFGHGSGDALEIEENAFMHYGSLETEIICPEAAKPNPAIKDYEWEYSGRIVEYLES